MKKIFSLLFVLVSVSSLSAQDTNSSFSLTIEGFVNTDNPSKASIVFVLDDVPKEVLYNRVLVHLTSIYSSAKDVVSSVENEVITLNAKQPRAILCKTVKYDLQYTASIHFKDGRIRVEITSFRCSAFGGGKPYRLTMSGSNAGFGSEVTIGLFKKNGEQGQKKTIAELEYFFNTLTLGIIEAASGTSAEEDW